MQEPRQPSTVEPMIGLTVAVLVVVTLACVEMDRFQPWLAELVDRVALRLGLV